MHFPGLRRRIILAIIVVFALNLGLTDAIPVDTPEAIELPDAVETSEAAHLASRKPGHNGGWATFCKLFLITVGPFANQSASVDDTEEGRGACGKYNHNKEHVVAIGKPLWESTQGHSGASTLCGKTATVKWKGKSVRVRVVDECPVCGYNDIDLSPAAFQKLANKDVGKLDGIVWKFD
ncbi:unnamed protein product [Rhizoctonia solani]|uniref:RlpA-like protein double-psi beta-barrel domain-containing protein n=1 Tax=Rhizoctonia solani TaxID=456999 RepID=A0A8H2WRR6_9AGAM|nr:unnamed protein product [Rhizoctonia solani]